MAIDWATVFDECHRQPGLSEANLERFVGDVARPMNPTEIEDVNRGQRNPFPPTDPLHPTWRPFDPDAWVIPSQPLLPSYLSFLRWSNGGEFRTGQREFGFFPAFDEGSGVRAMLVAYQLPQYMPHALPIAFNGGGVFYLFDMRKSPIDGEYPVVCASAGNLGWEPDEYKMVAGSFVAACRGTINIETLLYSNP